ncbi:MAG: hypothetical protein ABSF44_11770 [Candidatus Bathyarchaeia archaeon]
MKVLIISSWTEIQKTCVKLKTKTNTERRPFNNHNSTPLKSLKRQESTVPKRKRGSIRSATEQLGSKIINILMDKLK